MGIGSFKLPISSGGTPPVTGWTQSYYEDIFNNSYDRPTDWLDITTSYPLVQGDQKIVGLHSVFDNQSNFCAFTCSTSTGDYRVTWGDGTTNDYASGVTAEHNYDWVDLPTGTTTTYGYRQAIVEVIPLTGDFTSVNYNVRHSQENLDYSTSWLDIRMASDTLTGLTVGGTTVYQRMLEQFEYVGTNVITDASQTFRECSALVKIVDLYFPSTVTQYGLTFYGCSALVTIPEWDMSSANIISQTFQNCYSLRTVPILNGNWAQISYSFNSCHSLEYMPVMTMTSLTHSQNTFQNCYSLKSVPPWDYSSGMYFSAMFQNCYSLTSVNINTSNVVLMEYMFQYCTSLTEITLDTTSAYNNTQTFGGCYSLETVTLTGGQLNSVNTGYMFSSCFSLKNVTGLNLPIATDMSGMFRDCYNLQYIDLFDTSSATTVELMFYNCPSLLSIPEFNFSSVNNVNGFSQTFRLCSSLVTVPNLVLTASTTSTNFDLTFYDCRSLSSCKMDDIKNSISFLNSRLGRDAIVDIFNRLTTQTGKTITITGNWGITDLTAGDRLIATDKGWTIVE